MKKSTQIKYEIEIKKYYSFNEKELIDALKIYQEEEKEGELAYFTDFNDFVECLFNRIFECDQVIEFEDLNGKDQIEFKKLLIENYVNYFPNMAIDLMKEEEDLQK